MMVIMKDLTGKKPVIHQSSYIHPSAFINGDVVIGRDSSVWPFASIRGDVDTIRIGNRSNIQDGCVIHTDVGYPVEIGDEVTMGHGAILHGATVERRCIIGIRSTVLNGSVIGEGSIVGAGAVITPGTEIPPNSMVLGVPGKIRNKDPRYAEMAERNAEEYVTIGKWYLSI